MSSNHQMIHEEENVAGPSGTSSATHIAGFGGHLVDETLVTAEGEDALTFYLVFLTFTAALAGFIFGYDTGVVGVALPLVGTDLTGSALTSSQQEIITAGVSIGAIFGAAILGSLADRLGRKWTLLIADILFTVGSILIAASYSLAQMIVGRLIVGIGVGGATAVAPLYIAEIAPTAMRGRCIAAYAFFTPLAQLISDAIGAGVQETKNGWRLLFALGVIPSMLQLVLVEFLPESPRVLILRGKPDEAKKALRAVYSKASDTAIELKFRVVQEYVAASTIFKNDTMWQRIKRLGEPSYLRSIVSVSVINFMGQFTGYNTLLYYAGTLFGLLGLTNPAVGGLIPSGVNAAFLGIGMLSVDRVGRRGLLLLVVPFMLAGLVWCIVAFYHLCKPTGGILDTSYAYDKTSVGIVIGGIVFYVAGFGASYSHLIWYSSEFLALEIRATGSAISTTTIWVSNLIVSVSYLSELETLTPAGTYGLYLAISLVGYVFAYFCFPETKGLSIDETYTLFDDGFGIEKSREMRREKDQALRSALDAERAAQQADAQHKGATVAHVDRRKQIHQAAADKRQVSHVEMAGFVRGLETAQERRSGGSR